MLAKLNLARWQQASCWVVALSGGLDSTALLHLLHQHLQQQSGPRLRAIHIQHGLQQAAQAWPEHCQRLCDQLGITLQIIEVQVSAQASVEQAARDARYQAFAQELRAGEILMLGQHADDQAETLLLRLLRGAGVRGLRAMPLERELGQGSLARPLLAVPRSELEKYAAAHQLSWVEDPTNQENDFDRNYLRNLVMPLLYERWPGVLQVFSRTCAQMQDSQALMDDLARHDLQAARVESCPQWLSVPQLSLDAVLQLPLRRQRNLLRFWLADKTQMPDSRHWAGWQALSTAGKDANPYWRLQAGLVVRSGQRLYWLDSNWLDVPPNLCTPLTKAGVYELPDNGHLELTGAMPKDLQLRYRQGGEQVCLPNRGRRDLKRLLQEQQVPWFVRNRLPLLYVGDELVTVANYPQLSQQQAFVCRWLPAL